MFTAETTIRRLALRGVRNGISERRLRARQVLAGLDLAPDRLSPGALLVVRRLGDPLPERLQIGAPSAAMTLTWEIAVRTRLAGLAAVAARPAAGPVAADAPAVLFAEASELLACLGRDWARGDLGCWWWRTLFPRGVDEAAVVRAWREHASAVPATLARLARIGEAEAFVSRLAPASALALAYALATTYGLAAVREAVAHEAVAHGADSRFDAGGRASVVATQLPPWTMWKASDATPSPSRESEYLLGLALTLAHAPAEARRPAFAAATGRWWTGAVNAARSEASKTTAPPPRVGETGDGAMPKPQGAAHVATTPVPDTRLRVERERPITKIATRVDPMFLATGTANSPDVRAGAPALELETPPAPAFAGTSAPPVPEHSLLAPGLRIQTEFGGVFFLVDLALFLGLYNDFSQPKRRGLSLPIWDFLALAGEDLVGAELRADPIWPLLASLAGRPPEVEPGAQGRRPSSAYGRHHWWKALAPYLRRRLALSLGLEEAEPMGHLICRHAATVEITDEDVHVSFSIESHPLSIRWAGLDRDPGLVPAAGRRFFFHFS